MLKSPIISKLWVENPNKKSSAIRNRNYLIYIGTRDGVDLSEPLLNMEIEQNENTPNEVYLKYIHERPGSHGLFGNIITEDINKVANYIADETAKGKCIYKGIISLTEENAIKLGYDQKENWMNLLNTIIDDVAKEFNITPSYLNFCGAVHMEPGHPHCHYMFWDIRDKVRSPFIHVSVQNRVREMISGVINEEAIQQDILNKTLQRDLILDLNRQLLENEFDEIISNQDKISGRINKTDINDVAKELIKLTQSLPDNGRLAYKLMPPEIKKEIDKLVERVLKVSTIQIEFDKYVATINSISKNYSASESHTRYTEDKNIQDIKKRLANQILKTCKKIRDTEIGIDYVAEPKENNVNEEIDEEIDIDYKADWSKSYKQAIKDLYNPEIKDINNVIEILHKEALQGNVLAMHDIGKIYVKGIKTEKNPELAEQYYKAAFKGFKYLVKRPENEKKLQYYTYRLGKMYEAGNGTEQDFEKALFCYQTASDNKYAQYSLASMYLRHKGIEVTPENEEYYYTSAIKLLKQSAESDNAFASYTLSKNSESRNILNLSAKYINEHYLIAANKFEKMMDDAENDFLLYRLGTMYYNGKGVKQDDEKAFEYFSRSAEMNNANALYAMGKYYADKNMDIYNPVTAKQYFLTAIKEGNEFAKYSLALLYTDATTDLFDIKRAIELLEEISEENVSAKYQLGKIYTDTTFEKYDLQKGMKYFEECSELGNTNAMYQLGKVYADNTSNYYDIHKGMEYLEKSMHNGNSYAMAKLGSIYLWGKHEPEVERNIELGLRYLHEAAEQGNASAQDMINFYENCKSSIVPSLSYYMLQSMNKFMCQTNNASHEEINLKKFARQSKEYKKVQAKLHERRQEID